MWKIPKNQQQKKIRNENMNTARFQNTKLTYKSQLPPLWQKMKKN